MDRFQRGQPLGGGGTAEFGQCPVRWFQFAGDVVAQRCAPPFGVAGGARPGDDRDHLLDAGLIERAER